MNRFDITFVIHTDKKIVYQKNLDVFNKLAHVKIRYYEGKFAEPHRRALWRFDILFGTPVDYYRVIFDADEYISAKWLRWIYHWTNKHPNKSMYSTPTWTHFFEPVVMAGMILVAPNTTTCTSDLEELIQEAKPEYVKAKEECMTGEEKTRSFWYSFDEYLLIYYWLPKVNRTNVIPMKVPDTSNRGRIITRYQTKNIPL